MTFQYRNIPASGTVVVKPDSGVLHAVVVLKTSASTIEIYDNSSAASGDSIGTMKASIVEGSYIFDCDFINGLVLKLNGASEVTVIYS